MATMNGRIGGSRRARLREGWALPMLLGLLLVGAACASGLFGTSFQWVCCTVLSLLILFLTAAFQVSHRLKRALPRLGAPASAMLMLLLGCFILVLPLMPDANGKADQPFFNVFGGIYTTIQVIILQIAYGDWMSVAAEANPGSWVTAVYAVDLFLYVVALPTVSLFVAVPAIIDGFSDTGIRFQSWLASRPWAREARDIYVFQGMDARARALAQSLFSHLHEELDTCRHTSRGDHQIRNRFLPPLIVFSDMGPDQRDSHATDLEALKEASRDVASIALTPLAADDVPRALARVSARCRVSYVLFSDNADANVRTAIKLTDCIVNQLELEELLYEAQPAAPDGPLSSGTLEHAKRIRIYCTHANPDDDLIFDALPKRGPSQGLLHALRDRFGDDAQAIRRLEAIDPHVRHLLEVRLIDEVQESVYNTFAEYPLFNALNPVRIGDLVDEHARPKAAELARAHQLLTVVVVGLGTYGTQALRAAFWFGRLPGVELRIIGIDRAGAEKAAQLAGACPGMMRERVMPGEASACFGLGPGARPAQTQRHHPAGAEATVTICEMDATSCDFDALLAGRAVPGWRATDPAQVQAPQSEATAPATLHNGILEPCQARIPDDARIYAIVALGDDERDLGLSLHIQRALAGRAASGRFRLSYIGTARTAGTPVENPMVVPLIKNPQVLESASHLSLTNERSFSIHPFGANEDTFSYDQVFGGLWEQRSVNESAAYAIMHDGMDPTAGEAVRDRLREKYNEQEILKHSNRAAARFTPYRIWMMGLDEPGASAMEATNLRAGNEEGWFDRIKGTWAGALGLTGDEQEMFGLMRAEGLDYAPNADPVQALRAFEEAMRASYPVLCAMGDIEHARWDAFYRANGWTDTACDQALAGYRRLLGKPSAQKSDELKWHHYLVDSLDELLARGAERRDSPFCYDRAVIAAMPLMIACRWLPRA